MATIASPVDSAPSGGADLDLGATLSEAFDSATSQDSPSAEVDLAPETSAEPAEPVESADQPTESAEASPEDLPWKLAEDGKHLLVPKTELSSIQAAQQFQQEVGQYFTTPAEAQTAYLQASDLRAMGNDWLNGSDAAVEGVLAHWAGQNHSANPAVQARYQQSFAKMATKIPDMLRNIAPQAYEGLVQSIIPRAIEMAYEKAARTGNPEDFQRAKELDWGATGQYKTELPKADPEAQRRQQWEQEKSAFDKRQNDALKRDVAAFNQSSVEGSKFSKLNELIDQTLAPLKGRYSEVAFTDMRNGIRTELINQLQARAEWWREHEQTFHQIMDDFRTSWRNGSPGSGLQPRIEAYQASFLSQAKRLLPSIAKPRIEARTENGTPRAPNGQFTRSAPKPSTNGTTQASSSSAPSAPNGRLSQDQWDKEFGAVFAPFRR